MNRRVSTPSRRASSRICANRLKKMPCLRPFGVLWQAVADTNREAARVGSSSMLVHPREPQPRRLVGLTRLLLARKPQSLPILLQRFALIHRVCNRSLNGGIQMRDVTVDRLLSERR